MKLKKLIKGVSASAVAGVLCFAVGCSSDDSGTTLEPITLDPPVGDDAPPLSPTGLETGKVDGKGFSVRWDANAEGDLGGYNVYLYDPDPFRDQSYVKLNSSSLSRAKFVFNAAANGLADGSSGEDPSFFVRVSAVDVGGNESSLSAPMQVSLNSDNPNDSDQAPREDEGSQPGHGPTYPEPPEGDGRTPTDRDPGNG